MITDHALKPLKEKLMKKVFLTQKLKKSVLSLNMVEPKCCITQQLVHKQTGW